MKTLEDLKRWSTLLRQNHIELHTSLDEYIEAWERDKFELEDLRRRLMETYHRQAITEIELNKRRLGDEL